MKIVFAIAVLIITSSLASAALLTVNCSVVSSPTELNANIVCPQFSGAGLTSVQISVSGGITGSITLTNNASTSQTVTGTTSSAFSVGPLAGFTFVNPIFSASFTTGPQTRRLKLSVWRPHSRTFPTEITGHFWLDAICLSAAPGSSASRP